MADTNTKDIISAFNELIATCRDGIDGFRTAAEATTTESLRMLFSRRASAIEESMADLEGVVRELGGTPVESEHLAASLRHTWERSKAGLGAHDDEGIIKFVVSGEEAAVKMYRTVLGKPLPVEAKLLIERQLHGVEHTLTAMRAVGGIAATSDRIVAAAGRDRSRDDAGFRA
jgi:uncharacterized protein (TIGR02284 family)